MKFEKNENTVFFNALSKKDSGKINFNITVDRTPEEEKAFDKIKKFIEKNGSCSFGKLWYLFFTSRAVKVDIIGYEDFSKLIVDAIHDSGGKEYIFDLSKEIRFWHIMDICNKLEYLLYGDVIDSYMVLDKKVGIQDEKKVIDQKIFVKINIVLLEHYLDKNFQIFM